MTSPSSAPRPTTALGRASDAVARVEMRVAGLLVGAVSALILLNVVTRYFNYALYWVDEAAITAMVWATLVAASFLVRERRLISVTIVYDTLSPPLRQAFSIAIDVIVLGFGLFLIWLCWIWFDPVALIGADFKISDFVMQTGNFIYGEPTTTMGIKKVWLWLIMPVFALTITLHAAANLLDSLVLPPRPAEAPHAEI